MTSHIDVSVIIPIYNQEERLARCLDSVLDQKDISLEVVCINDGSTDSSLSILHDYASIDRRIKIIDQSNQGAGRSRNIGILAARGEFVIFCDSDDVIPSPFAYARLFKVAKENDALISAGSFSLREIGDPSLNTDFDGLLWGYSFSAEGMVEYRDYQYDYGFTRFMINRAFLVDNEIFFPDYLRYEDPVFLVNALSMAERFYAIPDTVYECFVGHQSVQWNNDQVADLLRGIRDNLILSKNLALTQLHALTVRRLEEEYGGLFVLERLDAESLELLFEINLIIDWTFLDNAQPRLLAPINGIIADLAWYSEISNTLAFKIARYLTAIPRRLKRRFSKDDRTCH